MPANVTKSIQLMDACLGLVTQKLHARPPWLNITDRQEEFVSPDYIPEGFTIREPSCLKVSEKELLLDFWRARQDNPKAKHAFLWAAHLTSGEMVVHNYVIASEELSSGPARRKSSKKTKKPKKRKAKGLTAKKGKSMAVSTAAESENESELATPIKVPQPTKTETGGDHITSESGLGSPGTDVKQWSVDTDGRGDDDDETMVDIQGESVQQVECKQRFKKAVTKSCSVTDDEQLDQNVAGDEAFGVDAPVVPVLESLYQQPEVKQVKKSQENGSSDKEIESDKFDTLPITQLPQATRAITPWMSIQLVEISAIVTAGKGRSKDRKTVKRKVTPRPAYVAKVKTCYKQLYVSLTVYSSYCHKRNILRLQTMLQQSKQGLYYLKTLRISQASVVPAHRRPSGSRWKNGASQSR